MRKNNAHCIHNLVGIFSKICGKGHRAFDSLNACTRWHVNAVIAPACQAGRPAGRTAATCAIHGQPILASPKPRETSALFPLLLFAMPRCANIANTPPDRARGAAQRGAAQRDSTSRTRNASERARARALFPCALCTTNARIALVKRVRHAVTAAHRWG